MQKYKTLEEFFKDLKDPRKSEVEALRKIILDTDSSLKEELKWNAPSYSYHDKDRITFNLFDKNSTRLIFHIGGEQKEDKKAPAAFKDESGLLNWNSNLRATVIFDNIEQIQKHKQDLIKIINKWLEVFD